MLSDREFFDQFEGLTLPPEYFDHRGHLRIAWLYLRQYDPDEALARIASGIREYAASLGAADKYQHTLTEAIVRIMAVRMQATPTRGLDEFLDLNADLVEDFRGVLLQYYSEDLLFSDCARTAWVEPDLAPLPLIQREPTHVQHRQTG